MTLSLEPGHVSIRNCVRQYLKLPVSTHSCITDEVYQLSRVKENKNVLNREMKPQETKVHYIIPRITHLSADQIRSIITCTLPKGQNLGYQEKFFFFSLFSIYLFGCIKPYGARGPEHEGSVAVLLHVGSKFPNQGSNPHSLHWKAGS